MLFVFALQVGLLLFLLRQVRREILWAATVGHADERLVERLGQLVESRQSSAVERWVELTKNSIVGRCGAAARRASTGTDAVDDLISQWSAAGGQRMYVLHGLGRMASVCTLLAIVIELSWGLAGGSGLEALQAGLPQRMAFRNVLTSLSIGLVTLGVYAWAGRYLRSRVAKTTKTLRRIPKAMGDLPSQAESL